MISNLLSGAIGAILGSLMALAFQLMLEKSKARLRIAIESVEQIESMYHCCLSMLNPRALTQEERRLTMLELLKGCLSHSTILKLELVFKEQDIKDTYEKLNSGFRKFARAVDQNQIRDEIIKSDIDPHYQKLCNILSQKITFFRESPFYFFR